MCNDCLQGESIINHTCHTTLSNTLHGRILFSSTQSHAHLCAHLVCMVFHHVNYSVSQQNRAAINIETVSGPCNTCFWYARAPAVRNTSRGGARAYQKHVLHGPETVSIFIANLLAIFNDILRKILTILFAKNMGLSLLRTYSPDVVRHCARFLKFSQIDAIDYF